MIGFLEGILGIIRAHRRHTPIEVSIDFGAVGGKFERDKDPLLRDEAIAGGGGLCSNNRIEAGQGLYC
jgi:hypothetical protein